MHADNDFIDDIEGQFLGQVGHQEKKRAVRRASSAEITERKSRQLTPFRQLLKRLVDRGLIVNHCERDGAVRKAPQAFAVYENESSDSLLPGVSIFLEHPAQIEIAIPNEADIPTRGVVVILCATDHPDRRMLQGPFRSMREAAMALADFIARNTVAIERAD